MEHYQFATMRMTKTINKKIRNASSYPEKQSVANKSAIRLDAFHAPCFHLENTLESGQVFHWVRQGEGWQGVVNNRAIYVEQRGDMLFHAPGMDPVIRHYFALDHPLEQIYETFPQDTYSLKALGICKGIRIIRQPIWECLATFICSAMKQVAHIKQMSHAMRTRFGEPVEGSVVGAFPSPARLANGREETLRACGLGFRASKLKAAAAMIASGKIDLEALRNKSSSEAREILCQLPGVGPKIANCVLLFAYERLEAVPVDVWIKRILLGMMAQPKFDSAQIEAFIQDRFGNYAGYVQQYLFHYARNTKQLPIS